MADYAITGKKGAGKSVTAVGIIRDALVQGKRVATNLDINLEHLTKPTSKHTITRIPDHPTITDLRLLGRGQSGVEEDENGLIILDETSHYFNARSYQDKGRLEVLEWLTQSRKLGWDVYYIMQGLQQMDKQVRETQIEYVVRIARTDKWRIPILGWIGEEIFGEKRNPFKFPKLQLASWRQGIERDAFKIRTRMYSSKELYPAYNTQQLFKAPQTVTINGKEEKWHEVGMHTLLSHWHTKGRYMKPRPTLAKLIRYLPHIGLYLLCKAFNHPLPVKRQYRLAHN